MSYIPGTIFRIYIDETRHFTAKLLQNDTILEIKNPDNTSKTIFNTLNDWITTRQLDITSIRIETPEEQKKKDNKNKKTTNKSNKVKIPELTEFSSLNWSVWCYKIMENLDKSLLKNPDVIKAFNAFTDICKKYILELDTKHYKYISKGKAFYSPYLLKYELKNSNINWKGELEDDKWFGLNFTFRNEYWPCLGSKIPQETFDKMREEIIACYKNIYDLIAPSLVPKLTKKYEYYNIKEDIKDAKITIKSYEKSVTKKMRCIENKIRDIQNIEKDVSEYKAIIEKTSLELVELENKLITFNA